MERWNLTALPPSTEKQTPRAPGPDAPRAPRRDRQIPRVLLSTPDCRAVAVALASGEGMGEHRVRERALVYVVGGRVSIEAGGGTAECETGTLVALDPAETHSVRAQADSMLLLVLSPWPAAEHFGDGEEADARHLPPNASVRPAD